jgi:hypothetical protein
LFYLLKRLNIVSDFLYKKNKSRKLLFLPLNKAINRENK